MEENSQPPLSIPPVIVDGSDDTHPLTDEDFVGAALAHEAEVLRSPPFATGKSLHGAVPDRCVPEEEQVGVEEIFDDSVFSDQSSSLKPLKPIGFDNLGSHITEVFEDEDGNRFWFPKVAENVCITKGSHITEVFEDEDGNRFWLPKVAENVRITKGQCFRSYDEAFLAYKAYAHAGGFVVRRGGYKRYKGFITHRLMLCNKAGLAKSQNINTLNFGQLQPSRFRSIKVSNCMALIRLKVVMRTESMVVYSFEERHNHPMVSSDDMDLVRSSRDLKQDDVRFIYSMNLNGVGPNVAHRLKSSIVGGNHQMSSTKGAYKHVSREIRTFIGHRDVTIVSNHLEQRKINRPNFSYELLQECGVLKCIFWADDVSQINYRKFGDVLAVDATYSTNMYKMIFVPFTGVDHHKRCVTFGAGLIYNESVESYTWLLSTFLKTHQTQPRLVLSDQDPSLRIVVPNVFSKANHRLCMWHIMRKLPSKVSGTVLKNRNIRRSIHKLVWNVYIKPSTFEDRWTRLIAVSGLEDNAWLNDMFAIRQLWVPAYFREIPLCCLMKTTSRCESSNALFKVTSSPSNTLVQFFMGFDNALDQQRNNQRSDEFVTNSTCLTIVTGQETEKHAAKLYTQKIFFEVQKEIKKSIVNCFITNCDNADNSKVYSVTHLDVRLDFVNVFMVTVQMSDNLFECSCRLFERIGYLCRHVYCVLRALNVTRIPDRYVLPRWLRNSLPRSVYSIDQRASFDSSPQAVARHDVLELVNCCIDHLVGHPDGLGDFAEQLRRLKDGIFENYPVQSSKKKRRLVITDIVGDGGQSDVSLTPPLGIRNKGCGTSRRLIGPGEAAVEKGKKKIRFCHACKKYVPHDTRNCPGDDEVVEGDGGGKTAK